MGLFRPSQVDKIVTAVQERNAAEKAHGRGSAEYRRPEAAILRVRGNASEDEREEAGARLAGER